MKENIVVVVSMVPYVSISTSVILAVVAEKASLLAVHLVLVNKITVKISINHENIIVKNLFKN